MMDSDQAAREILKKLEQIPDLNETARRQLFCVHIAYLFPEYSWQISEYAVGSEQSVKFTPKLGKKTVTGRIDTRKGAIVIEYKTSIRSEQEQTEAEDQLKEYISGVNNKEGLGAILKCISTDIINWHEYKIEILSSDGQNQIKPTDVVLKDKRSYSFNSTNPERFVETVRRLVFEEVPLVANGNLLQDFFGLNSDAYLEFNTVLDKLWLSIKDEPENQLALRLWSEYIENCFRKELKPNEKMYLNHAYLLILARMIAGSAVSTTSELASQTFPERCITGTFFSSGTHRVERFVEQDFFRWTSSSKSLDKLKPALIDVHNKLQRLDFRSAKKIDLIHDLYQQLMPPEHKAEYGAVFTPTWLVNKIVDDVPNINRLGITVLDPAVGTGSFLRAVVEKKLKSLPKGTSPQKTLELVLGDITGLDINPISIVMAKTSIMLLLAEWLRESDSPVEIPIYLCDSLFLPDSIAKEGNDEILIVTFDESIIELPKKLFVKDSLPFDLLVNEAEDIAKSIVYGNLAEKFVKARMNENLNKIFHEVQLNEQEKTVLTSSSFKLIDDLVIRIRERRNNVWAFVLKNTYRPSLLKARFDIILSNPPWLAMSSFPAARYKSQLEKLIDKYNLTPSAQSKHHMEIATVFSVHSVAHYLRKNGIFAFVLPRVILNGDQHSPFRLSSFRQISPMKVDLLWDLEKVSPLFGRPACVIFGSYEGTGSGLPIELPRIEVSGNPNEYNKLIWKKKRSLHLNNLDSKTWFDENSIYRSTSKKGYQDLFRQGADLMPRRAVMVNIIGNRKAKILSVETSSIERANRLNKSPWDKIEFEGTIECEYIFTTLKSDSLLPFIVGKCAYAALPIEAYENKWRILKYGDLISRNHRKAREWFNKIDQKLKRLGNKTLNTWLNRKNKLTDQVLNHSKYLVLYGAGGTNVAAAVVNTSKFDFPFVNDQTLYAWDSSDENEAWYVCGMLNSLVINDAIKNKQPKGQFGEQHIHKLPLSLIPKFNPHNTFHRSLAQEAKLISLKAVRLCAANPNYINVAKSLASRRRAFSKVLAKDMNNLNEMAKQILSV